MTSASRKYYASHREKEKARVSLYRVLNAGKLRSSTRDYRVSHAEQIRAQRHQYHLNLLQREFDPYENPLPKTCNYKVEHQHEI